MKCLLPTTVFLTLVLASCANVPARVQENAPAVPPESTQNNTSAETVSENTIEVVGGNEEELREFIRQWVIPVYPNETSQDVTVYIGSLPNDVPYELPIPADSRTIGSITGTWVDYTLIFDSDLTTESIHEFYEQSLTNKGWKEAPLTQGWGFTSQADLYQTYCYEEDKAALGVETPSGLNDRTSLRLTLDLSPDPHMCSADPNYGSTLMSAIPELKAPKGIVVHGTGAGSSDRDAQVTATLNGNLSAAEVADFYNEQLLASGWKLQNDGDGEGAAWSQWTFQDEQGVDWIGALMIMEASPESNTLFAFVSIEKSK